MDACLYKSLTGFDNWEGVKLMLKASGNFKQFQCQDDSINFVSFVQTTADKLNGQPYDLLSNQFAVVINCINCGDLRTDPVTGVAAINKFITTSLNGDEIVFYNMDANGLLFCSSISGNSAIEFTSTIQFVIFACY